MKIFKNPPKENWQKLCQRPSENITGIDKKVQQIITAVEKNGDEALRRLTLQFDHVKLTRFAVTSREMEKGETIPESLKNAIYLAKQNIEKFHNAQKEKIEKIETTPGVTCWRKSLPIEKVGLYIPGGTAPLFSTLLMLGIPAKIAGCKKIIVCTPPYKNGTVHPTVLFTAKLLGIEKIYKVGGAQAVAAMAMGTETFEKVDKIFGPGNQYVTLAKQKIQERGVAIDMPAGPSEVLVIADKNADPQFVAADLLSQAEHGTDSQVILLCPHEKKLSKILSEIEKQLSGLPRKEIAGQALQNSKAIILKDTDEAICFSNCYAPEHLIINTQNAQRLADKVVNAGSVFIGRFSCESAGDYASGTNHTLPTNQYARNYSGVSLDSFMKKITFQKINPEGMLSIGPAIEKMAEAEGLQAHKKAVTYRIKKINNEN